MLLKKFVTIAITDPFQKNGTIKLYEDFSFFLWITGGISNGKHSGMHTRDAFMKLPKDVAQKMKRSIKDFFIKIDQIFIQ